MPSAYAHLRFGNEVLERLPAELAQRIRSEEELFRLGLIGPDFLFFYRPFLPNRVIPLGRRIHADAGLRFFTRGAKVLRRSGFSPAHFAYLCGSVCHFALDSGCHGYISAFIARQNVGHIELEDSFDRALMRLDGKDAEKCVLGQFSVTREQSAVIAGFYGNLSPKKVRGAVAYTSYLGTAYHCLRGVTGRGLCGILCGSECRRRRQAMKKGRIGLMKRYRASLKTAVRLVTRLEDSARGRARWDEAYSLSFAGKKVL